MTQGGTIISARGALTITGITVGDGPWLVGLFNKDLSLSELDAYLGQDGPVHQDDTTAVEVASRGKKIRTLAVLVPVGAETVAGFYLPDKSIGLRWSEDAAGWSTFIFNMGPTMQTGALWRGQLAMFVRWASR